jgi:hypothetical protein
MVLICVLINCRETEANYSVPSKSVEEMDRILHSHLATMLGIIEKAHAH